MMKQLRFGVASLVALVISGTIPLPALQFLPSSTASIATVRQSFEASSGFRGNPVADPAVAVGRDRLVTITNAEVAIFAKTGAVVARKALHPFFLPAMVSGESSAGDVSAVFDPQTERFFLAEAGKIQPQTCTPGRCVGHNLLAVSKSSVPASLDSADWYFYALDRYQDRTPSGTAFTVHWGDFDKLVVGRDALVITSRQYHEENDRPVGPKIRVLDKRLLISGAVNQAWVDIIPDPERDRDLYAGIMPAFGLENAPSLFLVSRGPCGLTIWAIANPLDRPEVSTANVRLACSDGAIPEASQPDLATSIDVSGSGHNALPHYRDGRLWVADTVAHNFGSGVVAAISWAEVDVSQWPSVTVVQQGLIGEDGVWNFWPGVAVDREGHAALAFYASGRALYPSLRVAARLASDPLGTMRSPVIVKAGSGSITQVQPHPQYPNGRNRFADYLYFVYDPWQGGGWLHGQYGRTGDWRSWVGNIFIAAPSPQ